MRVLVAALALLLSMAAAQPVAPESAVVLDQTSVSVTGLSGHRVRSIQTPVTGGILVATDESPGLFEARGDQFVPITFCNDQGWTLSQPDQVHFYFEADGRAWWVQRWNTTSAVAFRDPTTSCWQQQDLRATARIVEMVISNGKLLTQTSNAGWFGSYLGLALPDAPRESRGEWVAQDHGGSQPVPELDTSTVTAVATDLEGVAWVGTSDGIIRIGRNTWTIPPAPTGEIIALVADAYVVRKSIGGTHELFARSGRVWEPVPHCNGSAGFDFEVTQLKIHNDELLIATSQGLIRHNVMARCVAEPDGWDYDRVVDLHVDQQSNQLWIATGRGLVSLDLQSNALSEVALDDPEPVLSVWQDANGAVVFSQINAVTRSPDAVATFSAGRRAKGVLVAGQSVVADRSDNSLKIVGTDQQVHFDPVVSDIEPAADGSAQVWVGSNDGLWLVDLESGRKHRFDTTDGLPSGQVLDLDTANDGRLWIATDAGLVVHDDAGRPPHLAAALVTGNGGSCTDCRSNEIHFDSNQVLVEWSAVDTADWRGVSAELLVDGESVANSTSAPLTDNVDAGQSYSLGIRLTDRHFNTSSHDLGEVQVQTTPVGVQLRRAASNPLAWLALALVGTIGFGAFTVWRRTGRARVRDARLLLLGATESVADSTTTIDAELTIEQPTWLRWRRPTQTRHQGTVPWDVVRSNSVGREQLAPAAGQMLLTAALGATGAANLTRVVHSRLSANTRLRIESANDVIARRTQWLPWEGLADHDGPLTERDLTVTRGASTASARTRSPEPLRVLAVRSYLKGAEPLHLWDAQTQSLQAAFGHKNVHIRECASGGEHRYEELAAWFAEGWDIVHLYGHGETDRDFGGYVQFPIDSERGNVSQHGKFVTGRELKKALASAPQPPLLVVVAACRTASPHPSASSEPGPAEWLVGQGQCSHAVGFAYEFDQPEIAAFVDAFYPPLAAGLQVDIALTRARRAMGGAHERSALRMYSGPASGELYERK